MNTSPNNSRLVNKLISMGVTDANIAYRIMAEYLQTGKLVNAVLKFNKWFIMVLVLKYTETISKLLIILEFIFWEYLRVLRIIKED